jgi:hypothetical protein
MLKDVSKSLKKADIKMWFNGESEAFDVKYMK